MRQQFPRSRKWTHLTYPLHIGFGVQLLQARSLLGAQWPAGLAQERVGEQAAAHADPAVDAPDGQLNACGLQCLPPGEDVLIHAVYQSSIEIEKERRSRLHDRPPL